MERVNPFDTLRYSGNAQLLTGCFTAFTMMAEKYSCFALPYLHLARQFYPKYGVLYQIPPSEIQLKKKIIVHSYTKSYHSCKKPGLSFIFRPYQVDQRFIKPLIWLNLRSEKFSGDFFDHLTSGIIQ